MKRYAINWSKLAIRQLWLIHDYIAQDNLTAANNLVNAILEKTETLATFSDTGQIELTIIRFKRKYRYLVQGNYKIIYRKTGTKIFVMSIVDTRRKP